MNCLSATGLFYNSRFVADSDGNVEKNLWNEGTKHKHVKYYYQNGEECKYCI